MSNIVVKIPRRRSRVKVIKSKELIEKELEKKRKREEAIRLAETAVAQKAFDDELQQEEAEQERERLVEEERERQRLEDIQRIENSIRKDEEMARRSRPIETIFTEKFVISDSNQPIEINLNKIEEDTIPLEDAMTEVQNAYDRGFSDGQLASEAVFKTELAQQQEWIARIDEVASKLKLKFLEEANTFEKSLVDLATMVAEQIIEREISSSSDIIISRIKSTINDLENALIFNISLNPSDVHILENVKSKLVTDASRIEKMKITADPSIRPGGCILVTDAGTIDARISTQLNNIRKNMESVMSDASLSQSSMLED